MALAGIQYVGVEGCTKPCLDAILRFIQYGDEIQKVLLLTSEDDEHTSGHAFILYIDEGLVAVKEGFASGYGGEAPGGLSVALALFERFDIEINEHVITRAAIQRLNRSSLTERDIEKLEKSRRVAPQRWQYYILKQYDPHRFEGDEVDEQSPEGWFEKHESARKEYVNNINSNLNHSFPSSVIPYKILDSRLTSLSCKFSKNPDHVMLSAYRKLEGIVRKRTGLEGQGAKLFSSAFQGKDAPLYWEDIDMSELNGRVNLFTGIYMAYRNKRVHHEVSEYESPLAEFLLLNQLFLLEKEAVLKE